MIATTIAITDVIDMRTVIATATVVTIVTIGDTGAIVTGTGIEVETGVAKDRWIAITI
jgi:hypothetical protein